MSRIISVARVCLLACCVLPLFAANVFKQNNTDPLNEGSSWVSGVAPTAADLAIWSNQVTAANTVALTNAATWDGLKIANPGGPVTITGASMLTLDGGAAPDINMTTATKDLSIETPVTMSGTLTTDVVAGRTLNFKGPLITTATTWSKTGWGTVIFDGAITSGVATTLELQRGTNIFTGKYGGLNFTSTAAGARIYVGRTSGDATLIISNGVHEARGVDDQANADFVGVSTWGRLFMEGGSLRVPYLREAINNGNAEITVNNGTLEATGGVGTGTKAYALMIANNHTDASATANNGMGTLTVNGGQALFTNSVVKLASESSASTGSVTVNLNGGMLGLKQFYVGASVQVPKTVNLNGGLLQVTGSGALFTGVGSTNGTLRVNVGNGGAVIDTGANNVTNAPALLAAGIGGLTKLGSGMLTLSGTNTYTGKTRVQAGLLRFVDAAAALHPDIALSSSGGLSMRDGQLSTFSPSALENRVVGAATVELELSGESSACDVLALPAAAFAGRINVVPVIQGTTKRAKRPGDYVIMTYAGGAPDVSRFTVLDPAPLCSYSFILNADEKTVTLQIANGSSVSEWVATGGGVWETASNWSSAPANATGTQVLMGNYALTAPATVTASAPLTLGGATFDSALSYTLSGPGFTFDNGSADSYLAVTSGSHTVAAPLGLSGNLSVTPASSASVTLSGPVGGTGALVKNGNGELWLMTTNTYTGGTVLNQGAIVLSGGATLGSGTVTAQGGSGFRIVGASPLTLPNNVTVASSVTFNAQDGDVTLTGLLDWQGSGRTVTKSGPNEMRLTTPVSETSARFIVEGGTLRFTSGANCYLACGDRDTIQMQADNAYSRTVVIDSGANLDVEGFYLQYGLSNTVVVQGGTLNMRGGGQYNDVCLLRANGAGIDRFVVNGGTVASGADTWFNIGIRGGSGALGALTINGGTTTLGRVSMGVRAESGSFGGNGRVEVNGGRLNVAAFFNWMGDGWTGRTNTVVLGNGTPGSGVLRLPATLNTSYLIANQAVLVFNGGTLETAGLSTYGGNSLADYLYGAKQIFVNVGGARIDTLGNDLAITQPLQKGAVTDGGLTKLGAGTLTLTGACGFTGATTVEAGALNVPSSYASEGLTLASGTAFSMANGSVQTLALSTAALSSGATITFEALADASACDRIALPSGATIGDLSVAVVQAGTSVAASRPGDYVLFTFAGSAPTVSGWTLLNPPAGRTSSFEIVDSTVVLRIAYAAGPSIWTNGGSGDWETEGNWTALPTDAAGTAVRFDDAITAPATVTRSAGSTVGSVTFNNLQPYTLAGTTLTLAGADAESAEIKAESGVHTVAAPVTLASETVVRASAGAAVALNGGVSGSTALTVEGPGALALPGTSGVAIASLNFVSAGMLVVSNSATWTTPVTLGAGGGVFALATGTTLDVASAVTGGGSLTKGTSSLLVLTNANANYSGLTKVTAGTLRLDTLPGGGVEFGQGTLHYIGGSTTTPGGYALNTGSDARAGVLQADGDITFQGNVSAASGALVKTGPGTVTFTAPGLNVFNAGNGAGVSHSVLDIGPYGDSPTVGFSGFNISDGKVVIGAPDQINHFNGLVVVGLNSTTNYNAETAGLLDVVDGVTTVSDTLIVGRSNGTTNTAPVARTSKLRMTGGDLSVGTLVLGRALTAAGHNSAPEAEMLGGMLTATNSVIVGEQTGSSGTLKLNGGTLVAPNIIRLNGQGHVQFNGGVFRPSANGQTLQGMTSAKVGANGARFDLSLASAYTLTQVLTTDGSDGGLIKTGAGILVVNSKQRYDGPTLVSEGTLRIPVAGGLSNVTVLAASPGTALELDTSNTQTVSLAGLTLGEVSAVPVSVTMAFLADGSANDRILVDGSVTLGQVAFTFARAGLGDAFGINGTYTLITYTGADPSKAGLSVANPAYGKSYSFATDSGTVRMTVATDYSATGGAVWKAAGGGNWSDAGNWVTAPGAGDVGQHVRFDDAITSPATVTLDNPATIGTAYFNNANAYTLTGTAPLTFDGGTATQAVVVVDAGSHTVAAPVSVSDGGLTVQTISGTTLTFGGTVSGNGPLVKTASGYLVAGAASTRTGSTEVQGGELVLKDGGNVGSGELILNNAYGVRVIGTAPAALGNPVKLKSGSPMIITMQDRPLTLSGALDWQTGVGVAYKWGTNELVLAGTGGSTNGTPKLYVRQGGVTFATGADYTLMGSTRESIKLGLQANTKTSLTVENGASVKIGGILVSAEATSSAGNDAVITQNGGTLTLNNTSGDSGDALVLRDWGTAPASYVMNGGTFTMPQASWANIGNYGPGRITVNGGSMTLGRFAAGYQAVSNVAAGGSSVITVNGGRLAAAGSWSWMSDSGARPTYVRVNGGTLALPATRTYGTNVNRWAALTLNGGTLETTGAALDTSAADDYLAGVRRVALEGVGVIDAKALNVTVRQNVLALSPTGGVTKIGSGILTLEGTNVLWGLVDVQEGTLRARLTHLDLPATPLFCFGMDSTANPDLSGNGFALAVSNPGTFIVTNRTATATALGFNGSGWFTAPHNPHYTNVTDFTVSAWLLLTNTVVGSTCSILSARPGGDRAFELKLMDGNLVRILQHSNDSENWWQEFRTVNAIPVGQWTHVAVSLTPQGVAMYLNGVRQQPIKQVYGSGGSSRDYPGSGYYYPGDFRFVPAGRTGGFIIGRPTSGAGPGFNGAMDDLMLFERALSDAEISTLASEAPARPASVRVAWQGTFDHMGEAAFVSEASGSGLFVNGTLAVKDRLSVGDTEAESPGALLTVANLTLGTNMVYACSGDGAVNDLTVVSGLLTVNGAGVVNFGRTASDPIANGFTTTVMTYGTITGASNLSNWTVTGLGRRGYEATVEASGGNVVVNVRSLWGTLMLLK